MSDDFSPPGSATGITWTEHVGRLLLFFVHSLETKVKTSFGETDAIRADVVVLDGPAAGEFIADTLIFPRVLVSQLKGVIGGRVLGRLGQGEAKAGQSAPWKLAVDWTEADAALAKAFLAPAADGSTSDGQPWADAGPASGAGTAATSDAPSPEEIAAAVALIAERKAANA